MFAQRNSASPFNCNYLLDRRHELKELSHSPVPVAVIGGSGVGKTSLLLQTVAHLRSIERPALYIDCSCVNSAAELAAAVSDNLEQQDVAASFWRADEDKPGKLLLALDEIDRIIGDKQLVPLLQDLRHWQDCQVIVAGSTHTAAALHDESSTRAFFRPLLLEPLSLKSVEILLGRDVLTADNLNLATIVYALTGGHPVLVLRIREELQGGSSDWRSVMLSEGLLSICRRLALGSLQPAEVHLLLATLEERAWSLARLQELLPDPACLRRALHNLLLQNVWRWQQGHLQLRIPLLRSALRLQQAGYYDARGD